MTNLVKQQQLARELFRKEFSNVGWHLDNKARLLDFIDTIVSQSFEAGREEMIEDIKVHKEAVIELTNKLLDSHKGEEKI